MAYGYGEIEFAMCALRGLLIVSVVALVAFATKSRIVFLAGTLGSLLGFVVPEPGIHINGTGEGIFMAHLTWTANHILQWGIGGAAIGIIVVVALRVMPRPKKQFSLRSLLLAMAAIAVLAAGIRIARG